MVFNTIFNNISVKSWLQVLLEEETRVPIENQLHPKHKSDGDPVFGFRGSVKKVCNVYVHDSIQLKLLI
jgi:hypothetical protein